MKLHSLYCGIRFFQKLLTAKLFRRNIPIYVLIHVNNKCNLRCSYCYTNPKNRFDKNIRDFTTEELKSLIAEAKSLGTRWISFLGGEPLLRDDMGEIIRYANRKGILTEMTTNGILIKQKIDNIIGLDGICISVDGVGKANDIVRGKGTYRKIVEGIKAVKEAKMNVRLHAVFTRANMHSLEGLAKLAKRLGVLLGYSQAHQYPPEAAPMMNFSREEYRKLWIEVKKLKDNGYPIYNGSKILDYVINWPFDYTETLGERSRFPPDFKPIPCYMGRRMCYVDSEGVVYPCIQLGIKNGLNFLKVGFRKAWEHASKHSYCEYCGMVQYVECNHLFHLHHNILLAGAKHLLK